MIQPNVIPPIAREIGLVIKNNYRLFNRYQTEVLQSKRCSLVCSTLDQVSHSNVVEPKIKCCTLICVNKLPNDTV